MKKYTKVKRSQARRNTTLGGFVGMELEIRDTKRPVENGYDFYNNGQLIAQCMEVKPKDVVCR